MMGIWVFASSAFNCVGFTGQSKAMKIVMYFWNWYLRNGLSIAFRRHLFFFCSFRSVAVAKRDNKHKQKLLCRIKVMVNHHHQFIETLFDLSYPFPVCIHNTINRRHCRLTLYIYTHTHTQSIF